MLKTTTNPALLPDPAERQAAEWFDQQTKLPNGMKHTLPFGNDKDWVNWLFDKVLCRLFNEVVVEQTIIEEKHFFRVTLKSLWRKHTFYLTPLSAYMHGNAMMVVNKLGLSQDIYVETSNDAGVIYIPTWAQRKVFDACAAITKDHEALIKEQMTFMKSLFDDDKPEQLH